ncbi:MAG TPA: adenylyltransferase/cytidyltransferase family protein [Chthoniobacterales bacterium]|nr:adenylyltransferase/cytidyltransferase family protein [Chthoniobacterales bacterium]
MNDKVLTLDALAAKARDLRTRGQKLVATNGCFDLLHVGHVRYLQAARRMGDALVVGVNGDASVRALKGESRPLNGEAERAEILAALAAVDFVTIFPQLRATEFLKRARPAVYVKGGDYTPETLDADERSALSEVGAEIRIIPFEAGYSTSSLIERINC